MIECENLKFSCNSNALKAKIYGEIDHHNARHLREKIDTMLFAKKPKKLVLDFSSVTFMDSSGLGLIMGRYTTASAIGASIVIYRPSPRVKTILEMSGIERLIQIKGDDDYAL